MNQEKLRKGLAYSLNGETASDEQERVSKNQLHCSYGMFLMSFEVWRRRFSATGSLFEQSNVGTSVFWKGGENFDL